MVGASDDQKVDAPSLEAEIAEKKQNLRRAASEFDPLAPLRKRPFTVVGAAAVLGVVAASPAAARVKQTKKVSKSLTMGASLAAMAVKIVASRLQKMQVEKAAALQRSVEAADAANLHSQDPVTQTNA